MLFHGRFASLRVRLLLLVLLSLLPAFGLIVYSALDNRIKAASEAEQQTRQLAVLIAGEQARLIEQTRQMLATLADLPLVRDEDMRPRCQAALDKIRRRAPLYANIGMVDGQGNLLCSAIPFTDPINFGDRSWFRHAVAGRDFAIGDYLVGRLTSMPSLGLAYPFIGKDGAVEKVIYATLDLTWLQDVAARLPQPPGTVIAIVDGNGTVLVRHPDPSHAWMGRTLPPKDRALPRDCSGFAELRGIDGIVRLSAVEPMQWTDGKCVHVRVGVPRKAVFAPIEHAFRRDLGLMAIIAAIVFVIAWFGADRIILRRIRVLTEAARRFGEGDMAVRSNLSHTAEEVGRLAMTFDAMAESLQTREAELRTADRALARANRALTVISSGNRVMLKASDERSLLDGMCRVIVEKGGYRVAWVGLIEPDTGTLACVARFGFDAGVANPACLDRDGRLADEPRPDVLASARCAATEALRGGRAAVLKESEDRMPPACKICPECVAVLALPLARGSDVFGVLVIYATEAEAFGEAEIDLLGEAAGDLAYGIDRLRDQARRREAEDANRLKSEFLANMSHELRTPLNAVIGFSEVMKDGLLGEMTPKQTEYVTDIFQSGRHLLALINDILDLSKVEAGKMELDLEPVAIADLLEGSRSVIREKAAAHRIALILEAQENLPAILIDARKTKQIVYNLLSNAVKFTPDGGRVELRARRVTRGEVENWSAGRADGIRLPLPPGQHAEFLEIAVEDTGIGIRREDAPRLFQPFSQLDASLSRRYEGTGLGLTMVMKMAELHGGTVAVASEPGRGSRFTVWLPWREGAEIDKTADALRSAGAGGRTALVVEDNDEAAALIRLQLEAAGFEVDRVTSAEAALARTAEAQPGVIVLDIFLPGMDGWDYLARIKRPDSPWRTVPVVIATIAADAKRGFSLGAAQVLQKPVGHEEIAEAMNRLGLGPLAGKTHKVLIVDDDPKAAELLAAYLAEPGYEVTRVHGGREAIEAIGRDIPDLIVLDLMMPEVSGFDVLEATKTNPETAGVPIVVVTAKSLTAEDRAQLNGHVATVLEKAAFNHGRFLAEVRRALARGGPV